MLRPNPYHVGEHHLPPQERNLNKLGCATHLYLYRITLLSALALLPMK